MDQALKLINQLPEVAEFDRKLRRKKAGKDAPELRYQVVVEPRHCCDNQARDYCLWGFLAGARTSESMNVWVEFLVDARDGAIDVAEVAGASGAVPYREWSHKLHRQ